MLGVILAGGSGSRLWPLSRELYPKQLLSFDDNLSLLQQTFKRLNSSINSGDILTVTNVKHYSDVKLQLDILDKNNIIVGEPIGRNTAPAIAVALQYFIEKGYSDETVLIVPSDHLIKDIENWNKTVKIADELASEGYIVTFGIKPAYPETGYGYIKTNKPLKKGYKVERFVEKPDIETAERYVLNGDYYWNGGVFAGKISTFINEMKKYVPDIVKNLSLVDFPKNKQIDYSVYEKMPAVSIDYAVMEKSDKIALVELMSDWSDLGSWQSLYNIKNKDENGNVLTGKIIVDNVYNSLVYSQKELVAVSGLNDIILVETEDAIMACKMDGSQNVKKLYDKLKESNTTKLHKTVFRPWGYYTCLNEGDGYLTKTICVLPKHKLSVQSHNYRSEHWVVLEGEALVLKDNREYKIYPGDSIDIPLGVKHSLQNPNDTELKIIEIQKGTYISEDDIIRYEDCYGRV